MDERPLWERTNHFTDRETNLMQRVLSVNESWATIEVLGALTSRWSMPVKQYDDTWASRVVPVDMGALKPPEKYRAPHNVEPWRRDLPAAPAFDAERGETPGGVRIGGSEGPG